jgi:hypothetical protein
MVGEAPNLPVTHESVSLDEFEQVNLDVISHHTVGPDHFARLAVNIVPGSPDLRS